MTHPFNIGDKVVCVDDRINPLTPDATMPKQGSVYVVERVGPAYYMGVEVLGFAVYLVGLYSGPAGFMHTRFRKLSDIQEENRIRRMTKKTAVHPVDSMYP